MNGEFSQFLTVKNWIFFITWAIMRYVMSLNNEIKLMGNLVRDPDVYESANGKHAKIRMAANTKRGDKEDTLFIDVKLFGFAHRDFEYFSPKKGDKIGVVGRLSVDEFTDKNGNERREAVIYANDLFKIAKRASQESSF